MLYSQKLSQVPTTLRKNRRRLRLGTWVQNWRPERGLIEEILSIEDSITSTIEDSLEINLFQEILDIILDLDMTTSKHPEDKKI